MLARKALLRLAAAGAAAGLLAGCSGSSGGGAAGGAAGGATIPQKGTDLETALAYVAYSASGLHETDFGRPKAANAAKVLDEAANETFENAVGGASFQHKDLVGFDGIAAEWVVGVGPIRDSTSVIDGIGTSGVAARMTALGGKPIAGGPGRLYRIRADDRMPDPMDTDPNSLLLENTFDVVAVLPNAVVHSGSLASVQRAASPAGKSMLDDSRVASVAHCLGNPLVAMVSNNDGFSVAPGHLPVPAAELSLFGIGVVADGSTVTDELCALAATPADATQIAARARTALASGTIGGTGSRWTSAVTGAQVATSGRLVTITAHPVPGNGGGAFFASLQNGAAPGLSG